MFADLHVHTDYSDSTRSVEDVLALARACGIGLLAITDHNVLEGSQRLLDAHAPDIQRLSGVELDCVQDGTHLHVLGYGFTPDSGFREFVANIRQRLDAMSDTLIARMAQGPIDVRNTVPAGAARGNAADNAPKSILTRAPNAVQICAADYAAYTQPQPGGWKALHYLVARGTAENLRAAVRLYGDYDVTYTKAGFPDLPTVCHEIRRAGGVPVLAHPWDSLWKNTYHAKETQAFDLQTFVENIKKLTPLGLGGIECHYPTHSRSVIKACLEICRQQSLIVTGGSDDHGTFWPMPTFVRPDIAQIRLR